MSKFQAGLVTLSLGLLSTSCIKQPSSKTKVDAWSPELHSSIEIGSGFVPDSFEFVENCTNISYYENSIVERDVNTTREYSNLSDSSSSSSSSISGSVNLALGKNSAKIEANKSSESQSRVTVSDDYIFIKRRELTIKPNFLSRVAIKASSVSGAFFNNCGSEYTDELAYGGFLHIKMQLNSSSQKDLKSMKSEISPAPIAWLKSLTASASGEANSSNENKGVSLELSLDSNIPLKCLNTEESSAKTCSLDNPEACSQLVNLIDSCKSEFRETVTKKPYTEFEEPIYVTTSPYPALNATFAYWNRERQILQTYIDTLIEVGRKVDDSQSQPLGEASKLFDKMSADFPACVYKLDESDLSLIELQNMQSQSNCAEGYCSDLEMFSGSRGLTGTVCDKYVPNIIQLKKTQEYQKVAAIYETDLGLKGLAAVANPKSENEYSSFTYVIGKGETVEIDAKQLKKGPFEMKIFLKDPMNVHHKLDEDQRILKDNGQKVIITNDKLPKMILQLEMRHRIYNWGKARREWRNSACVLNNMTISCSNYHTGRHDHVEYNFYPYMEMVAE